mmetsp:Transcript_21678/g.66696  ORF Transcript_21678/g.66696 Transcript_21678/m.66696 type:complete len:305 (+) Transcript_21678:1011-1925(+)
MPRLKLLHEADDGTAPHEVAAARGAELRAREEDLVLRVGRVEFERRREFHVAAVLVRLVSREIGAFELVEAPVNGNARVRLREIRLVFVAAFELLRPREHVFGREPLLRFFGRRESRGADRQGYAGRQRTEHQRERRGLSPDNRNVALEHRRRHRRTLGAAPLTAAAQAPARGDGLVGLDLEGFLGRVDVGGLLVRGRRADDPNGWRTDHHEPVIHEDAYRGKYSEGGNRHYRRRRRREERHGRRKRRVENRLERARVGVGDAPLQVRGPRLAGLSRHVLDGLMPRVAVDKNVVRTDPKDDEDH